MLERALAIDKAREALEALKEKRSPHLGSA
jgi:hypothetical protein